MRTLALTLPVLLAACGPVSRAYTIKPAETPLARPKTVVFLGTGEAKDTRGIGAAAFAFGEVLREHGFEVKRFAKDDGSTPYGLDVKGEIAGRCDEGGFFIAWVNVIVVDMRRNEQVLAIGGNGRTEGCGPTVEYGNLFDQIVKLMGPAWAAPSSPPVAPTSL